LNAENLTPYSLEFWWTPNNGSLTNPNINNPVATMIDTSMTFEVFAMNIWGCRDSASVTIKATDGDVDFVPTGFTPNGDGLNDIFRIPNLKGHRLVDFSVYNRWGQLVYHNNTGDGTKGWDGTFNGEKQDVGVYNYVIILSHPDGTNRVFKGDISLLK
jgi:gliding motility-associated-like protein